VALLFGFTLFVRLINATERFGPVVVVIGHIPGSSRDADIIYLDCYISCFSLFTPWTYRDNVIVNTYQSHEWRFRINIIKV